MIYTIIYVVGWSLIPTFDKLALRTADQFALTWSVFMLCFIFMSTYFFIFTADVNTTAQGAIYNKYTLISAGGTTIVYISYFVLLNTKGVLYIVVLQPLLIGLQAIAGMLILKETLNVWNWCGMAVIIMGMLVYNGQELKNMMRNT